jgi:hypothetical protein
LEICLGGLVWGFGFDLFLFLFFFDKCVCTDLGIRLLLRPVFHISSSDVLTVESV